MSRTTGFGMDAFRFELEQAALHAVSAMAAAHLKMMLMLGSGS